MSVQRRYEESIHDLPRVAVPDWTLLERLDELLRPYARAGMFELGVDDHRGSYTAPDIETLREEMDRRGDPPRTVYVRTYDARGTWINVYMSPNWLGFGAIVRSPKEEVKNHVAARVREIFRLRALPAEEPSPTAPGTPHAHGRSDALTAWLRRHRHELLLGSILVLLAFLGSLILLLFEYGVLGGGGPIVVTVSADGPNEVLTVTVGEPTTATPVREREARDPKRGQVLVRSESSREFFNGSLVISVGMIYREWSGDRRVTRIVVRAGTAARCEFTGVRVGDSPGATTSEHLYWVDVRALSEKGAEVVAFEKAQADERAAPCPLVSVRPWTSP